MEGTTTTNNGQVPFIAGFGEYDQTRKYPQEEENAIRRIKPIALAAILGLSYATARKLFSARLNTLFVGGIAAVTGGYYLYQKFNDFCRASAPPCLSQLKYEERFHNRLGQEGTVEKAFVTPDALTSCQKKVLLISEAKEEILFIEAAPTTDEDALRVLSYFHGRLANSNVKVHIILGSDVKPAVQEVLLEMTRSFPDRFNVVLCPFLMPQAFPFDTDSAIDTKFVTTHAKLLIVDGASLVTGGSSTREGNQYTGLEPILDSGGFIARSFRDNDLFIYAKRGSEVIDTARLEFYKLLSRWDHYWSTENGKSCSIFDFVQKLAQAREASLVGKNTKELYQVCPNTGLKDFYRPLEAGGLEEIPNIFKEGDPDEASVYYSNPIGVKVFTTGPEHSQNPYAAELIDKINSAKKSITINHMYFHPSDEIFTALKNALDHGVKVTLILTGLPPNAPLCHEGFVPHNRINYLMLNGLGDRPNLEIYEWAVPGITLHKKCITIDDKYLFIGSSNLGYKSFRSQSDYEFNLVVNSENLVAEVDKINEVDKKHCANVKLSTLKEKIPSVKDIVCSAVYRISQAFWG